MRSPETLVSSQTFLRNNALDSIVFENRMFYVSRRIYRCRRVHSLLTYSPEKQTTTKCANKDEFSIFETTTSHNKDHVTYTEDGIRVEVGA